MKKYISFILAVLLSLCLVSCNGNQTDDGGETLTPTLIFGKNIAVYQDTVFYRDQFTREIKYQNMKNYKRNILHDILLIQQLHLILIIHMIQQKMHFRVFL